MIDNFTNKIGLHLDLISSKTNNIYDAMGGFVNRTIQKKSLELKEHLEQVRQQQVYDHAISLQMTQMKLRDTQIDRLQTRLREFITFEHQINYRVTEIEKKEACMVSKLENAICFGKAFFVMTALVS